MTRGRTKTLQSALAGGSPRATWADEADALVLGTSQGEAVHERRAADHLYRAFVEGMNGGAVTLHSDGTILYCNAGFAQIIRKPLAELVGTAMPHLVAADQAGDVARWLRAERPDHVRRDVRLQAGDGTLVPVQIGLSQQGFDGERVLCLVVSDLSARDECAETRRNAALLSAVNRVLQESLATTTARDVALVCLAVAREITGAQIGFIGEIDDVGGMNATAVNALHWTLCPALAAGAFDSMGDAGMRGMWGAVIERECTQIANDMGGQPHGVELAEGQPGVHCFMGVPLKRQGRTVGLIGLANRDGGFTPTDQAKVEAISAVFMEVLERKRIEVELQRHRQQLEELVRQRTAELEKTNQELEHEVEARRAMQESDSARAQELARSNAELEEFAYVASHDLKAPLRAIDNLSQWIAEDLGDVLTGEARENMVIMRGRVRRLDALLNDLLQYSRAGRVGTDVSVVDTAAMIREIVVLLDPPEGFSIGVEGDMPTFVTASGPLEQVLRNLINNAIKHHDRKSGRVVVSVKEQESRYEFAVADDGPGIPPELHAKAFQMFQTLRPRDAVEGSGMGLAVVKKLVEWQGGTIRLDCGLDGRGATFRFTWKKAWPGKEAEPCPIPAL